MLMMSTQLFREMGPPLSGVEWKNPMGYKEPVLLGF